MYEVTFYDGKNHDTRQTRKMKIHPRPGSWIELDGKRWFVLSVIFP